MSTPSPVTPKRYRHPQGGGAKLYPAQASPDTFLDEGSTIEGNTNLYTCSIRQSAVRDSFLANSTAIDSLIADSRFSRARVVNSDILNSDIVGSEVESCRLTDCRVFTNEGLSPVLTGVKLSGVTVYGDAQLTGPWGLEMEGAHIHVGVWTEAPRSLLIEGNGIHEAVVECTGGRVNMGCRCGTREEWLGRGPRLAERFGWSEEQQEQCRKFLLTLT